MPDTVLAGRIRMARGSMTQAQFANRTDLSRQSMINYEAGRTIPSTIHLKKIALASGVAVAWLLGDISDLPPGAFIMLPADATLPAIPILSEGQAGDIGQEPLQLNMLPLEHQKALKPQEGSGKYWEGDNEYWLTRPADVRDLTAYSMRVKGDSMSPKLEEGQLVVASPIKQVYSGDLAVVKIKDDAVLLKVVYFRNGKVELRSFNPEHETKIFDREDIEFMNKIVWLKL